MKIHAVADARGKPLVFLLTPGQAAGCQAAETLLDGLPARYIVHADRAYDTNRIRDLIERQGAVSYIPPKTNRRWKGCFSRSLYKGRNAIARVSKTVDALPRAMTVQPQSSSAASTSPPASCGLVSPALAGSVDGSIHVWDGISGVYQARLGAHDTAIRSIVFRPTRTGALVASCDGDVRIWTLDDRGGHPVGYRPDYRRLVCIAPLHGGRRFAVLLENGYLDILDPTNGAVTKAGGWISAGSVDRGGLSVSFDGQEIACFQSSIDELYT